MSQVLPFLKPYQRPVIIAILLMLVELIVELWHPLLMAKIINEGIHQQDLSAVLRWGGFMLALALLGFICGIINSFYAAYVSQNFGFDIRKSLFEKVQSFSFANFNRFPTSTLITRVTSDVTQMQSIVFMSLRIMMRAPLLIIGGMVMALVVNAKLALILVIITPFLLWFLVRMMNQAFIWFRSVQERLDRVNGILRENLLGIRLIKAFVRYHYESSRFTSVSNDLMTRTVSALRLVELVIPLLLLIMNVSVLLILWFGNLEVNTKGGNVGEVVAVINYTTRITGALSVVSMIVMQFSRAKASAQRISDVFETSTDISDTECADADLRITEGKVEFENVSFQYPGTSLPVLQSISFTVHPGETVAILGATGSGKSSLIQLVPRLYDVSGGSICIDGTDIRAMRTDILRKQIGVVPQEVLLFTGTVKDNIVWGKENASMEEIIEAAQCAQMPTPSS